MARDEGGSEDFHCRRLANARRSRLVPRLGKLRLDGIGVAAIERVRDQLRQAGLGPRTVNKILTTLTAILAWRSADATSQRTGRGRRALRDETVGYADVPSETPATEGLVEVTEADVLTASHKDPPRACCRRP